MVNAKDSRAKRGKASARVGLALLIGLGAWVGRLVPSTSRSRRDPIRY